MDIVDLKYFIAVAEAENMNQAARRLEVSPGTLSRSVGKLEAELGLELFARVGKGIGLNERGRILLTRARAIVSQMDGLGHELSSPAAIPELRVAGRGALMAIAGATLHDLWVKELGLTVAHFNLAAKDAVASVKSGENAISITERKPPPDFHSKEIARFAMVTCASIAHPAAKVRGRVPIAKILEYSFAAPVSGHDEDSDERRSADGWRDDLFPRKVAYTSDDFPVIEELCRSGKVLAYLPESRATALGLKVLDIDGCDIACSFKIHLGMRKTLQPEYVVKAFKLAKSI